MNNNSPPIFQMKSKNEFNKEKHREKFLHLNIHPAI